MNAFFDRIRRRQGEVNSLLCVGLDPDPDRIPGEFLSQEKPIFAFNKMIIDATADYACCYKPQIAHFAAVGAEAELQLTIDYIQSLGIPVILDAKRGDVGSTGDFYAREAFDRYHADAVTANPYMGGDSLKPLLEREDKGVLLLCRTSNPGGADLQNLVLATGEQLFERVADLAANQWNNNNNVGLVVGATRPEELARVRQITGDMTLLLPGIGAQGGDVKASLAAGQGGGLIISASRSILYPRSSSPGQAAKATRDEINRYHRA